MGEIPDETLARERAYDAAALRIAERVRSSLDLTEVLAQTLDEIGLATGVSRSLIQLVPDETGHARMLEWDRGDTSPLNVVPPTPVARRVFATGEPVVIEDIADEDDEELERYLQSVGSQSVIAFPVKWHGRVTAVLGFQDSRPRAWDEDALPLLQRLEAQVAAAIAQAEVFAQQQEALDQLQDLNRMREELIANVSHELRTPLTAILGGVKTLKRSDLTLDQAGRRQLLDVLEQQTERLHMLAEDLLDLARFRRGGRQLQRRPVKFSDLVTQALHGILVPEDRNLVVRIEHDPAVVVDRHRMGQVLANLVQNAVRHGSGDIEIRCRTEGDSAVIHVSDEGRGVDATFAQEMFEPFVHDSGRTDSSGLGLPIARAIVEAHGGSLDYVAAERDRAHQFVVTLPAAAAQ